MFRTQLFLLILILSVSCNKSATPQSNRYSKPDTVIEGKADGDNIDYAPDKYNKECFANLRENIFYHRMWVYDSIGRFYNVHSLLLKDLKARSIYCLFKTDSTEIVSLFGLPSYTDSRSFQYFISKPCIEQNNNCSYLSFTFDSLNRVRDYKIHSLTK